MSGYLGPRRHSCRYFEVHAPLRAGSWLGFGNYSFGDTVKIELEKENKHNIFWSVRCIDCFDNRYEDRLCFDEALGVIASILLGQNPRYLKTKEEHEAED